MADGWQVINQTETSEWVPGAGMESAWRVTYRTARVHVGTVTIPKRMYGPETVREMIDAEVRVLGEVADL